MIVREVVSNPELIDNFDWFNDYKDTRQFLERFEFNDLLDKLDKGWDLYLHSERIRNMSHFEMCRLHRTAVSGHPYFDSSNPLSKVWEEEFKKKGGFTPKISKQIGWET